MRLHLIRHGRTAANVHHLLDTAVPESAVALPLRPVQPSVQAVAVEQERWLGAPQWYLAVAAPLRQSDLVARVLHGCKVGSADVVDTLIRQALPGMELVHVAQPPAGVPVKLDFLYFAVRRAGPCDEVIVVDDTIHDISAARACGATVLAVATGSDPPEALAHADAVFRSMHELPAWHVSHLQRRGAPRSGPSAT